MPELPEVETVRRELEENLKLPQILDRVRLLRKNLRNPLNPKRLQIFEGQRMTQVTRRSKYLLFWFGERGLLSHLGMTGNWRVCQAPVSADGSLDLSGEASLRRPHDHIELILTSGLKLVYNDPRRFGFFDSFDSLETHPLLRNLGWEPLDPNLTADRLHGLFRKRKAPVKNLLMNQTLLAGLGNIYASEVLFRAGIRPFRRAGSLSLTECEKLRIEMRQVLEKSIQLGGSSFDDFRHVSGEKGDFQNHFFVYNRSGTPCQKCGQAILKKTLGGRSTFWCSRCQK
jgi:formamidopyrimidine-DNA glycosylase